MFKPLRRKSVVKFTLWVLLVAFVIWGAGSAATSRRNYAGILFGKKVSLQEYNRAYQAVLNRAQMMYGDNLPKIEKFLNLGQEAWDRLTLVYAAKESRIGASNKEVVVKIASIPIFQRNGIFDNRLYHHIVENIFRITPRDFEESMRDDIMTEKLIGNVIKDIKVSDDEIGQAYKDENELADVSYILIESQPYKEKAGATGDEIASFYKEHKDELLGPPMADVAYFKIPFNDEKQEARAVADEILARLREGMSFKEISKEYGIESKDTGFFSTNSAIPDIGFLPQFALAALGLNKNQIGEPVEAQDAFYIIKLKDKRPPSVLSFEEAKDKVKDMLIAKKAEDTSRLEAENLLAEIKKDNLSLGDAAAKYNYKVSAAKQITKVSYVEGVGISDAFGNAAFSLKKGDIGGPAKTQKGFCIIRLDSLTPIDENRFKEEKDSFSAKILQKKQAEHLQRWFVGLKGKASLKTTGLIRGG